MNFIAFALVEHAERSHALFFKVHKEGIHGLRVSLNNLNVLNIIVSVSLGDLIKQIEAFLEFVV